MSDKHYDLIIEQGRGISHYWRDLWQYRELFYFLAWRDLLVRYKQTAIGIAWSVMRPFLTGLRQKNKKELLKLFFSYNLFALY